MTDASIAVAAEAAPFARRAAALLAAESEHLPRVLDVVALGDRRELVLEAVDGPRLDEVLTRRGRLTPGEAVTVLLGAVRAIAALHSAGYGGIDLEPRSLGFDVQGRPMLLGTTALTELISAGAERAADDWRAAAGLASRLGLLARGRAPGPLGVAEAGSASRSPLSRDTRTPSHSIGSRRRFSRSPHRRRCVWTARRPPPSR